MTKKLLLIDGNSIAFRAFYALYNANGFTSDSGLHTSAIYGFNRMLDKVLAEEEPTKVLVAFDAGKTTFRTAIFSDYKGDRLRTPQELLEQIPYIKELVEDRGIVSYELDNYEADDIIGTFVKLAEDAGDYQTTVITGDRDLTQLSSDTTTVKVTKKGVTELDTFTPEFVKEKLGILPTQIVDFKGLKGDTSDNYPGVTKVGNVTATKLIQQFGSIESIYDNIESVSGKKLKEHLIEDRDKAFNAKKLATINRNSPVGIGLDDIDFNNAKTEKLIKLYKELGFKSFLKNMNTAETKSDFEFNKINYTQLTADNINEINSFDELTIQIELDDENYHQAEMLGFSIGFKDKWFVSNDVDLLKLSPIKSKLEDITVKKNLFDVKKNYVCLHRLGIELKNVDFDMLLVSYLLDTNNNSNDVGTISKLHGYENIRTDDEVYGKGAKKIIDPNSEEFFEHLVHKTYSIDYLHDKMFTKLNDNDQAKLYWDIELPVALVLSKMEINGITVSETTLSEMGSKLQERLSEIEQTIYQEAGEEFNIGSPKQLGVILFDKLKLPVIKKTKTGYSTAVDVLEKLAPDAQIVQNVLEYRQISKLLSTYIDGLIKVINPNDHKIHTRYLQTLTQTGRLSSVDPNLQNIPIRSEDGRKIRKAFVPSDNNWVIFSSDYSQIELRVLASITGDENLQMAFKNGEDIHEATARRIFGLAKDEVVNGDYRRQAKAVNFGIVYGISDYGLSQNTGISRKQAKTFIDKYFAEYPGVKEYMDNIVKQAREYGYVETIANRRRYLPDINNRNFSKRSFAERTAMNTPIQGSAADIIKIAMIKVQEAIKDLDTKMLLQVHDELIFEVPEYELEQIKELIPKVMDSAVKLEVPLKVESNWGHSWYDAK
ncbi:DNA polymerase I [Lentilactobacillus laojiaonis]|uniref:DNA polymerase I n=1 Tax=Lentilactobacillus laojiaonis TaxID=2883998 RepID=UPI001D0B9A3E|nr:DNA polymerase I [Lentilactobacillus laojiaonis]UDM32582.1 DNA polymerase I [Lentilactobacillus laojiaonis]